MSYEYTVTFKTGAVVNYYVPDDGKSSLWDQVDPSLVASFVYDGETPVTAVTVTPVVTTSVVVNPPVASGSLLDLPGEIVQWFKDLWNALLSWFDGVAASVYNLVAPLFNTVWDWIQGIVEPIIVGVGQLFSQVWSWVSSAVLDIVSQIAPLFSQVWSWVSSAVLDIVSQIAPLFNQVWSWINTAFDAMTTTVEGWFTSLSATMTQFASDVGAKVSAINDWFSNEFIDPFIDWLTQFPGKLMDAISLSLGKIWQNLTDYYNTANVWFYNTWNSHMPSWLQITNNPWSIFRVFGVELAFALVTYFTGTADIWLPMLGEMFTAIGPWLLDALNPLLTWFTSWLGDIGIWISLYFGQFIGWLGGLTTLAAAWFGANMVTMLAGGTVLTLEATGKLEVIVDKFVSPAITAVFNQFEALGPVSPVSGAGMGQSIGKLASFTIAGLTGMTIAGELLAPLKQIGLGNISAIIYDLINYKTLTAAFMSVLAMVYITQPLRYYYNRAARQMIPNEMELRTLYADQQITLDEYSDNMAWHGYPDTWIADMAGIAYRPLSAFLLSSLVSAGVMADSDVDEMVRLSGYGPETGVIIKEYVTRSKTTAAKALSSSTAVSAYKVGLDDETAFRNNLADLGYDQAESDRLVVSAELEYSYNYRSDLLSFYTDAYHRNDIEEPELRSDLASLGVVPGKIDLIVEAQKIKRLKVTAAAADPAIAIQLETIREQRTKQLINEDQETAEIVALGYELNYAQAITGQDTVKMQKTATITAPTVTLAYETASGKVDVDTIRRSTRARQMSADDEMTALIALQMPADLAQAIVDNDALRLVKAAAAS
jgi:hypothetical protein